MINRIAACYMLRGGEPYLEDSFKSIRDQVDKIIVIYTGIVTVKPTKSGKITSSLDMKISREDASLFRKYGCVVRHSPWNWSFSQHRNEAFLLAHHERCDWALIIDADEQLIAPKNRLRNLVKEPEFHGVHMLNLNNLLRNNKITSAWQVRFVSLYTHSYYDERIHNKMRSDGFHTYSPRQKDAVIFHRGYALGREEMTYKLNHRLLLIQAVIDTEGIKPELLFYQASLYHKSGQHELACALLLEYWKKWGPTPDLLSLLADTYRKLGKDRKAIKMFEKLIKLSPFHMDAYYYAALLYTCTKKSAGFLGWRKLSKKAIQPLNLKRAEELMKKHAQLAEQYHKEPTMYPCVQELFTMRDSKSGMKMIQDVKGAVAEGRTVTWNRVRDKAEKEYGAPTGSTPGKNPDYSSVFGA